MRALKARRCWSSIGLEVIGVQLAPGSARAVARVWRELLGWVPGFHFFKKNLKI